jgi:glycosyltransferase involved in cell wall biosynthesis
MSLPVSVIIVTRNEADSIAYCLSALSEFDDIWVVDSSSRDKTQNIARAAGAQVVDFKWDGTYPKKRQWCLHHLPLKYEWVFFVDGDEHVPRDLVEDIRQTVLSNPQEGGFFIEGRYRVHQKILRFGIPNLKIALLHRGRMEFPVIDDLDIPGMGEIEGHYQPVLKDNHHDRGIGRLMHFMIHDAMKDERAWIFRHEKYARWEAGMNAKGAWPIDPVPWRQRIKLILRASAFRAEWVFMIGYILKGGFLDGWGGLYIARMRYRYHKMIKRISG